jgi:Tfp pilus assembly protein PilF
VRLIVCAAALAVAAAQQSQDEIERELAAWMKVGLARAGRGELEAAAEAFRRACSLAPKDEDACYYYGRNLFALNRYGDAVEPLEKALRAAAKDRRWRVHRALARNFEWLDRAADAERHFREAVRLGRGRASQAEDPRVDFGSFLYRQGRTLEALKPLEEAAGSKPASPRAYAELGRVFLQLERVQEAAAALEKAVETDPRDWSARLLLGRAYLRLGRREAGERELEIGRQGMEEKRRP